MTSQLRRATVSIAANIAEGSSSGSDADFARFLHISIASASEVEYFCILAKDLGLLTATAADAWANDVSIIRRMILRLLMTLPALKAKKQRPN